MQSVNRDKFMSDTTAASASDINDKDIILGNIISIFLIADTEHFTPLAAALPGSAARIGVVSGWRCLSRTSLARV